MAVRFQTSFDTLGAIGDLTSLPGGPAVVSGNATLNATGGPSGNACLDMSGGGSSSALRWNWTTGSSVVGFGFWLYWTGGTDTYLITARSASSGDWYGWAIGVSEGGVITAARRDGGTRIGVSWEADEKMPDNTWVYFECEVVQSNSGSAKIWLNGKQILNATGDTQGLLTVNYIFLSLPSGSRVDDIIHFDNSGSDYTSAQGPQIIETLVPNASGDRTELTPSAGSNWENVDEIPNDGDTTYNESTAASQGDLYNFTNLTTLTGSISYMATAAYAKETGGTPNVGTLVKSGTTDFTTATPTAVGATYERVSDIFYENQDTTSAFTVTDINAIQVGIEVT